MKFLAFTFVTLFLLGIGSPVLPSSSPANEFWDQYDALRADNKWAQVASLGELVLEEMQRQDNIQGAAPVCAEMASAYFFLGNYDAVLRVARDCQRFAWRDSKHRHFVVNGLYLESAAYRAQGGRSQDKDAARVFFRQAVEAGERGVSTFEDLELDDQGLLGKAYFNLGAAHADDPEGNLASASACYEKALAIYRSEGDDYNYYRTALRDGKVKLLLRDDEGVKQVLGNLKTLEAPLRNRMHYEYLAAQYYQVTGEASLAKMYALRALEKAQNLHAKEDIRRLQNLLESLSHKAR